jgi:dethiobiotin synthetase
VLISSENRIFIVCITGLIQVMEYFVTGIGTDVGKTVVSALLCEILGADYWKPVQSGTQGGTDSEAISYLLGSAARIWPEAYCLREPISPHAAAYLEGVEIEAAKLRLPAAKRPLIIEGAGGVHVPLNNHQTFLDVLQVWDIPVIIVSRNYLGSINHTLLTIEVLQQRGIPIAGLIFNGSPTPLSEMVIASYSHLTVLGHVPEAESIDRNFIVQQAAELGPELLLKLRERHPLNVDVELARRLIIG